MMGPSRCIECGGLIQYAPHGAPCRCDSEDVVEIVDGYFEELDEDDED